MNLARLLAVVLIALAVSAPAASAQSQGRRASAVVELFTSQGGCSQCPRANRLLGAYSREDGVLGLTFPVGIWDYLGWEDTLARPEFGDRQRAYSAALRERRRTPQLVLNGARQVSAADWDDARAALDSARGAGWPPGAPDLSITRLASGRVRATLSGGAPRTSAADVWFASFDPGPIAVEVAAGVNRNRVIMHYNLVERLERAGAWSGGAVWFERAHCGPRCAVLLQEPNGGRIVAAAYLTR